MILARLAAADLRTSWRVWSGLCAVCAVAAVAGSVPGVLVVGGLRTPGVRGLALLSIAGTTAAFGLVAILVVVSAVARLTAGLLVRTYALWQLAGVTPGGVRVTVLVQTALVALLGAVVGVAATGVVVPATVGAALAGASGLDGVRVATSRLEAFSVIASTVVAAVVAGLAGSRRAAATPALLGAGPGTDGHRPPILPAAVAALLTALAASMLAGLPASVPHGAAPALLIGPGLVAAVAVLGRWVGTPVVRLWTAVVPANAWVSFGLARAAVRRAAARSDTTLAALLVAVALPTALVGGQRTAGTATGGDATGSGSAVTTVLVLSGPVLLAAVGAAATAAMASRDRAREREQLLAVGATPALPVGVAALEGVVLGVSGTLVAAATVALSVTAEWGVLAGQYPSTRPVLPVGLLLAIGGSCTALVVLTSIVPALPGWTRERNTPRD
ncbi:hypothetical protein Q7F20_04715 [Curtobacterium sp. A7_M15]|uniref:hypothetical protein n=1 Tax=Curtobacterium sp. A7_M15 TaxID=3065241 RepID=UPI0027377DD0|nr:hypothetical protein [Curtobacterium sp. A7_M15]MDP4332661.1 hypothetical protein [Curtobacterium sp. A7_M15]